MKSSVAPQGCTGATAGCSCRYPHHTKKNFLASQLLTDETGHLKKCQAFCHHWKWEPGLKGHLSGQQGGSTCRLPAGGLGRARWPAPRAPEQGLRDPSGHFPWGHWTSGAWPAFWRHQGLRGLGPSGRSEDHAPSASVAAVGVGWSWAAPRPRRSLPSLSVSLPLCPYLLSFLSFLFKLKQGKISVLNWAGRLGVFHL